MTDAEYVAIEIAKHYGLKAVRFINAPKFKKVTEAALEVMTADEVLDSVFECGGLNGLFNAYAGVMARIEKLVAEHAFSRQLAEDAAERADWAAKAAQQVAGKFRGSLWQTGSCTRTRPKRRSRANSLTRTCGTSLSMLWRQATVTHGPVYDADIEDAVIGGLLVARASLDEVLAAGLVPEDFYVPSHANAFAAICSLALAVSPLTT